MKYPLSIIAMFIGLNSFALCTNDKKKTLLIVAGLWD